MSLSLSVSSVNAPGCGTVGTRSSKKLSNITELKSFLSSRQIGGGLVFGMPSSLT